MTDCLLIYKVVATWSRPFQSTTMGREKQFSAELDRLQQVIAQDNNEDRTKLIKQIMEELRQSIFKTDSNGHYIFGRKGWPKVNWLGMLFAMGRIAAKIYVLNVVSRSFEEVE